ncbi:MAG TPA: polymer-forming cytoskeletal protein [Gemmatimonadaceae bacterium]|nr:polymer-forming cytoskeletal protein [Gemmatimonadaceae bacterium]
MRTRSRRLALIACVALCSAGRAAAQDTVAVEAMLSPAVAREAAARYNAALGVRATVPTRIDAAQVIDGDVAVLEAPLTIAGTIRGSVVAINGSVALLPGARVEGDILVVGGAVTGLDSARVRGEVRAYQARMHYQRDGAAIIPEDGEIASVFPWEVVRTGGERPNGLRVRSYHSYNRVEGLPIYAGPYITHETSRGVLTAELYGIVRTAEGLAWTSDNIGHRATVEVRTPGEFQLVVGGRLQDVVDPIEPWQLTDTESGLATFFLHRDFRDWYGRHGGVAYAGVSGPRGFSVVASLADERWASRRQLDPWTLFRDSDPWRPNPTVDDGRFHVARLTAAVDTRNDPRDPWAGWLAAVELERGAGRITSFGDRSRPTGVFSPVPVDAPLGVLPPASMHYLRGFLDVRRYNRLSPETQLNLRAVFVGWLAGDVLPLQRQVSVGGLGTIPGYDFRRGDESKTTCASVTAPGRPAECDRAVLVQGEYRVNLGVERLVQALIPTRSVDGALVVFVDAGRGWRVRNRNSEPDAFAGGTLPPVRTFLSDVGAGIDLSLIGIYVAKGVSGGNPPPNVFVRVRHRF